MEQAKRAKIAILTNYPADHRTFIGGVETATASLLEGLCAYQGEFEFHILSTDRDSSQDLVEEKSGFYYHFLSTPLRPRLIFKIIKAFRELKKIKPNLVHCQGNLAFALVAASSGYPCIYTIHGVMRDEASKRSGWEYWSAKVDYLMEQYVLNRFDAFICISEYAQHVVGYKKPFFLIPNAVRSLFFRSQFSEMLINKPYLLFIGVLAPLKRPHDLIQVHAVLRQQISGLETVICGDVENDRYLDQMHRMIDNMKIEGVKFIGHASQEKVRELLMGAVALVLPSSQENKPMVISEAMALGVPVVATRVGGIPELVIDGETGFLYETGDLNKLTNDLLKLLSDPLLRNRMGARSKILAKSDFSPSRVAGDTVVAYRQLMRR